MPVYEYECLEKGHRFEKLQKFSEPDLTACEACGGPVRKLISMSSFHLKGSGWYVTDYKSKSNGSSPTGAASDGAPSESASKAKGDACSTTGGSSDCPCSEPAKSKSS